MTEYQKARDFLVRAQKEQPFNHDINNELKKLARWDPFAGAQTQEMPARPGVLVSPPGKGPIASAAQRVLGGSAP